MPDRSIEELIAASSLGCPDAVAARGRTADKELREVVARSKEMCGRGDPTGPGVNGPETGPGSPLAGQNTEPVGEDTNGPERPT